MKFTRKNMFGQPRSRLGKITKALCFSAFPEQVDHLAQREKELNIPRSVLIQILLDLDREQDLLSKEISKRLRALLAARKAGRTRAAR
jgi:hypothetical protein